MRKLYIFLYTILYTCENMRQIQIQNNEKEIELVKTVAKKLGIKNITMIKKLSYESMVDSIMYSLKNALDSNVKETELGLYIYYSDFPGDKQETIITSFESGDDIYTVYLYNNNDDWYDIILFDHNDFTLIGYRLCSSKDYCP